MYCEWYKIRLCNIHNRYLPMIFGILCIDIKLNVTLYKATLKTKDGNT